MIRRIMEYIKRQLKEDVKMMYRMYDFHILPRYCVILRLLINRFTVPEFSFITAPEIK